MNKVVIGIGSNIDPENNIAQAKAILKEHVNLEKESTFKKSTPIGKKSQPDFINGAVLVLTNLDRKDLNSILKKIEKELNRVKTDDKYEPRTIDLDIIVWNDEIVDEDVYTRDFLKESVLELIPHLDQSIKR